MRILFAGTNESPQGGAHDIIATDVKLTKLAELIEANAALGYSWWHIYDTGKREIVLEGTFKASVVPVEKDSDGFATQTIKDAIDSVNRGLNGSRRHTRFKSK